MPKSRILATAAIAFAVAMVRRWGPKKHNTQRSYPRPSKTLHHCRRLICAKRIIVQPISS